MCDKEAIEAARDRLLDALWELDGAYFTGGVRQWQSIYWAIERDPRYVAFSLEVDGKISYAARREHIYCAKRRMRTTLGKFLSREYGVELTPEMETKLGVVASCNKEGTFTLREDVSQVYAESDHVDSCMVGQDCTQFYDNNGVKILTYTPGGQTKWQARALVWRTDCGQTYVDRIYPNNHSTYRPLYEKYAEANGWLIRENDSAGEYESRRLSVSVRVGPMPYMDTFYGLTSRGKLTTRGDGLACTSTSGEEPCQCNNCNDYYWEEDGREVDGDTYCSSCAEDAHYCESCNSTTFSEMSDVDGQCVCESCAESANRCDHCGEHTFSDLSSVGNEEWCDRCVRNDSFCCADCGEQFSDEELHTEGNDCLCESCHAEREEKREEEEANRETESSEVEST